MQTMELRTVRRILRVFVFLMLAAIVAFVFTESYVLFSAICIVFIFCLIFDRSFWRCPNCEHYLGYLYHDSKYCPFCGADLDLK